MTCQNITLPVKIKDYPLISVVIPIYNVEQFLKETLDSVCKQSYNNLEIILINDGSTDNSAKICEILAQQDNRIKLIHKENGGLSSARNLGIYKSKGDFIFFLDGDDFIDQFTIEKLLKCFYKYNNICIASAPCFMSYNDGNVSIFRSDWNIENERIIENKSFCLETLLQKTSHSACCKLYSRDLFDKVKFREGKKNEDTLFMFDLSSVLIDKKKNMIEIPDKLYYYRVNADSISRNISLPLQIDVIENLYDLKFLTSDQLVLKIIHKLYLNNILDFSISILINEELKNNINDNHLLKFENHFGKVNVFYYFKYTSIKTTLKYLLIKYFKIIYLIRYKLKQ